MLTTCKARTYVGQQSAVLRIPRRRADYARHTGLAAAVSPYPTMALSPASSTHAIEGEMGFSRVSIQYNQTPNTSPELPCPASHGQL